MKNKVVLVLIPLLLTGCNLLPSSKKSSSSQSSNNVTTTSNESTTQATTQTTQTTQSSTSTPTSSSSQGTSTTTTTSVEPGKLPCGYDILDKPSNSPIAITTSTSAEDWYEQRITDSNPTGYRYIYGNNTTSGQFYSYNENDEEQYPGGYKISKASQGFQSAMFSHSGAKLEIRVGISQVNESNGNPDKGKPTAFWYFYDKDGNFLSELSQNLDEGSIVKNTQYVRCYVTQKAEQVAYFEFRTNALPYKSQQNYNFGIGYVAIHSWTYA